MTIFKNEQFISHAKLRLPFKIDCDGLTNDDIETLAAIVGKKWKFSSVYGIPRGGVRLAKALEKYCSPETNGRILIIDDVLTTGTSMKEARRKIGKNSFGIVIFARQKCPQWIKPIFTLAPWARR